MKNEWYFKELDRAYEAQEARRDEAREKLRKWREQWEPLARMVDDTRKDN